MQYDAVIFDLFGTLVGNFPAEEYRTLLLSMAARLGVPGEPFLQGWKETFAQRARGEYGSVDENIRALCTRFPESLDERGIADAVALRFAFTGRLLVPHYDALPTLLRLKEEGYKLGLISDCSIEVPTLWESSPFGSLFDVTVFSCIARCKKPDPRIYHLACDQLKVSPERALFVGDGGSNELSGAAAVGLHPVHLRIPDESEETIYCVDGEEWSGDVITTPGEIFRLL